jgi:serine/threonine protein kinase/WD40 repeat protein
MQTIAVAKPVAAPPPEVAVMGANPDSSVPFVFGKQIAKGGMGAILEGEDCKLGRTIAVKVMLDPHASSDQARRFVQEAAVLGRLEHPNIVPIHDLGRDSEGALYYTMKLVKGRTLQHIIDDLRKEKKDAMEHYTLDRLLTIFRKVCDALAFAHANNIIHRDLKPENVMVGEFGEVLVMDWGIAKVLNELGIEEPSAVVSPQSMSGTSSFTATMDGAVMGTPNYMSPEQAMGKVNELDERSDIFSLGGILYAILTLRPPVEGKDVWEVLEKVQMANITAPTVFGATTTKKGTAKAKGDVLEAKKITPLPHMPGGRVPNALSAVAMKALTLDKTERYQHVAAFSADIEKYQGGFATSAENAGVMKQIALLIQRNKGIFTTAAAAWLLLTGLGVWFVFNLQAKEQRATQAEAVAVQREAETSKALARSQTSLAEAAYQEFDSLAMLTALGSVPEDLRDTDWRYLRARAENSQTALTFPNDNWFIGVAAHPKMPGVFAGALKGNTFVFVDALSGQRVFEFPGTERQRSVGWCRSLDFSPDGTRIIAGTLSTGGIAIYETATGKALVEWDARDIEWVRFSPDGMKTLDVNSVGELVVHDATNGKTLWTVKAATRAVFSPSGDVIVPSGRNIRVHDGITGALIRTLPDLRVGGHSPALSPDGSVLYLGCGDGVVRGQRLSDGAIIFEQRLTESLQPVRVAISADGRRLVGLVQLPGRRRLARVWDTATSVTLQTLMGGNGGIEGLAIHPLTDEAIISGPDTRTWALATRSMESKTSASWYASVFWGAEDVFIASEKPARFGDDGRWNDQPLLMPEECRGAFMAAAAGEVAVFGKHANAGLNLAIFRKAADGYALQQTVLTKAGVVQLRLSADGSRLAYFDQNKTAEVFDTTTGRRLCQCDGNLVTTFQDLGWIGADRILGIWTRGSRGAASAEEHISVWDAATGRVLRDVRNPFSADRLAVSPDGRTFAEGGENKRVRIRSAETLEVLREFRAHDATITSLAFHPTEPVLATGSVDLTVRLWSLADNSLIEEMRPSPTDSLKLSFSPRGTRLASTDRNGGVSIFNLTEPPLGKFTRRSSTSMSVTAASPAAKKAPPPTPKPALPKDADGWEDHLASLTPAGVETTGQGWSLKDGELISPAVQRAVLPLIGDFSGTSYTVRLRLRQGNAKNVFHVVLPIADRMCGFEMDRRGSVGVYTGLTMVNGKFGKDLPGAVEGKQVNDTEAHDLEVTVRLDGSSATVTAMLDARPLYQWTGLTSALSQYPSWATTKPGMIGLGTLAAEWVVSAVKVKRLEK